MSIIHGSDPIAEIFSNSCTASFIIWATSMKNLILKDKTYNFLAAFFIHLFTHIFLAQLKHFHLDIICTLMKQFCGQCNLKTILTIGHVILQIMWASKNRWYELFHNPTTIFHFIKKLCKVCKPQKINLHKYNVKVLFSLKHQNIKIAVYCWHLSLCLWLYLWLISTPFYGLCPHSIK